MRLCLVSEVLRRCESRVLTSEDVVYIYEQSKPGESRDKEVASLQCHCSDRPGSTKPQGAGVLPSDRNNAESVRASEGFDDMSIWFVRRDARGSPSSPFVEEKLKWPTEKASES